MTTRLYWQDSHLTSFTAGVAESFSADGRTVVVLDQTAFYPTGGGQPHDTGSINGVSVIEVSIDDQDRILHHLAAEATFLPGDTVE